MGVEHQFTSTSSSFQSFHQSLENILKKYSLSNFLLFLQIDSRQILTPNLAHNFF
jgi:hypothetical protein